MLSSLLRTVRRIRRIRLPIGLFQGAAAQGAAVQGAVVLVFCVSTISSTARAAEPLTLPELVALAKKLNPGLAASEQVTESVRARLTEARRSWFPTGKFLTLLAPVPSIECVPPQGLTRPPGVTARSFREQNCSGTNRRNPNVSFEGIYSRSQIEFVQPLWTFGKIENGIAAAKAGIEAARSQEKATISKLTFDITRAYWGLKLMREIRDTLDEGEGYLGEAEKRVQADLDEGTGSVTVTDKLRLKTVRADLESRILEAQKGVTIASSGIRALIGPGAPSDLEVDNEQLWPLDVADEEVRHYEEQAMLSRPEVRALDYFVTAKRRLVDMERSKMYPDLVIVGQASFAYASSVDDPINAFANDPFNVASGGLAAALQVPLDFATRSAKADRLNAEAEVAAWRRQEALGGIAFEVAKAHASLQEARARMRVLKKGEKVSRQWMTSMVQKMELGLAETKEIADALQGYFTMRLRHLQAIADFNIAAADLSRAVGTDVTDAP